MNNKHTFIAAMVLVAMPFLDAAARPATRVAYMCHYTGPSYGTHYGECFPLNETIQLVGGSKTIQIEKGLDCADNTESYRHVTFTVMTGEAEISAAANPGVVYSPTSHTLPATERASFTAAPPIVVNYKEHACAPATFTIKDMVQ